MLDEEVVRRWGRLFPPRPRGRAKGLLRHVGAAVGVRAAAEGDRALILVEEKQAELLWSSVYYELYGAEAIGYTGFVRSTPYLERRTPMATAALMDVELDPEIEHDAEKGVVAFQKVEEVAVAFQQLAIDGKLTKTQIAHWEKKVQQLYKGWLVLARKHHGLDPRSELAIAIEQCEAIIDSWRVVSIDVPPGLVGRGNPNPERYGDY